MLPNYVNIQRENSNERNNEYVYLKATPSHATPDINKVRLTNSEILRAQYLKKKHQENATPNYLSYRHQSTKHDYALNTIDGNIVSTEDIRTWI